MKKYWLSLAVILALPSCAMLSFVGRDWQKVEAAGGPTSGSLSGQMNINLNDSTNEEIRNYYADLNSLNQEELTGQNILKNLRPILQNFTYYSYDACWKIYEITDREWTLSPAEETTFGSYNAANNIIENYQFGTNASTPRNNPYLHNLYKNRDENGVTLEAGRLKAWEKHGQTSGGTDREHVWCQSRGFKANNSVATGPAGTDVHHLMAGDSRTNQTLHNNYPYGFVDKNQNYEDGNKYLPYITGNMNGSPLHSSIDDQSNVVFEPQDCDKGDIARACFYMVACYNNLSGEENISQYNPNLTLADFATSAGAREDSSATHAVAMGILSDLLEWNRIDPVDEYEIHRNNLIYNNFQHNRNPFVDFPIWAEYIWGNKQGQKASPLTDPINSLNENLNLNVTSKTLKVGETFELSATTKDGSGITWTINNDNVSLNKNSSDSKENIIVTANKEGNSIITASAVVNGEEFNATCQITISNTPITPEPENNKISPTMLIILAAVGVVIIVIIIVLLISVPKLRKKASKKAKKQVKKSIKQANRKK